MADYIPNLFDPVAGMAARDEAVERVDANADHVWKARALQAVRVLVGLGADFTTDDVWQILADWNVDAPHEPRALGAIMRRAQSLGLVAPTDQFRPSQRRETHYSPKRVWRST